MLPHPWMHSSLIFLMMMASGNIIGQDMDATEMLLAPLQDLPPVEFAFAYGSGVFEQPGNSHLARNEVWILS